MTSLRGSAVFLGLLLTFRTCVSVPMRSSGSRTTLRRLQQAGRLSSYSIYAQTGTYSGGGSSPYGPPPAYLEDDYSHDEKSRTMSRQVELQEESSAPFTSRKVDPLSSAKRLTTSVIRMESQLANMKAKTGAMYINCGGMAYGGMRDDQGLYSGDTKTYVTDKFVGITKRQHKDWAMAAEQAMMTHRYAVTGSLMYMIPADKPHFVTLYFAEIYEPMMGIGRREFHVFFNKKQFHLDHENSNVVDVFKDKGRLTLGMKTVLAIKPVNGHIHIMLHRIPGKNNPMISAISLEPAGGSE